MIGDSEAGPGTPEPPAEASAPSPADRIGRYEVRGLLGRGGMGSVYRGFDPMLEREVAIKVMLPEMVHDLEHKQRFEREARAVARLSHPSVVTVFDLGYHTDGSPYIVMELLRGRDLLTRLRAQPPLALADKIGVVIQLLEGLGHAHRAGIVHRDIKPANVFLVDEGGARIMDFGLAYFTAAGITSRNLMGTVAYMSPEQVRGELLDGRSDLFSVGTLLCELLTAKQPFTADSPGATLLRITGEEPRLELPDELRHFAPVLRKALRRPVDERFQTAGAFVEALRACASEMPATAGRPTEAPPPAADTAPATAPLAAERRADPSRLFELLRRIHVEKQTGQIHLASGANRRSLRIASGRIVNGSSDAPGEHLGDVLVRYGLLSQADLERAVAVVLSERRRLGAVLREQGRIDSEALTEAAGIHVRELLFSALDSPDLVFSFEEQAAEGPDRDAVSSHSMGQVILEATHRVFDQDLVRRMLGDTGRVLVVPEGTLLGSNEVTLTPTDGFVLSRIDGTTTARDVMALIPLPVEDVERSLFSLLCTGIIGYAQSAGARTGPGSRRAPVIAPARSTTPDQTTPEAARPAEPPAKPPAADAAPPRAEVTAEQARIRSLLEASARPGRDPFEVLACEPTLDEAVIRRAYASLARVLHPDVALDPTLEDVRHLRETAFVQIGQAYETLRSPLARRQAFEKATRGRIATEQPRDAVTTAAPSAPAGPAAGAPDRPNPPAAAAAAANDPELLVRRAQALFDKEQYWEVIQSLEPILAQTEGVVRVRARMLLAQTYLKNPKWKKQAEETLIELLRETPKYVPAHLLLADIYRSSGFNARARSAYQKVLAFQPENEAALQAMAELQPEPEPEPEPPKPGLLRGIFGKRTG